MGNRVILAGIAFALSSAAAIAAPPEPVSLEPIEHLPAELVVVDQAGTEHIYTPADLEQLGAYRLTTTTPWRDTPAVFEGASLRDLLERHGLADGDAILVVAENEFQTIIEREVWENVPMILATRVDGQAHSRRARGPIQFVVPDDIYSRGEHVFERHLVWMAARIQPSE